jgi:hypothetical protein
VISAACPTPTSSGPPAPPPPPAKIRRYADQGLQDTYARFMAALQTITVPVYGPIINDSQADNIARQVIDAARGLPNSLELQQSLRCMAQPAVASIATPAVRGLLALAALGGVAYVVTRMTARG